MLAGASHCWLVVGLAVADRCQNWLVSATTCAYTDSMSNKEFSIAVAAELRGIIAHKGLSRTEVSERAGIPSRTLARYLNDTPQLTIDTIHGLADAVGVGLGDLIDAAEQSLNN